MKPGVRKAPIALAIAFAAILGIGIFLGEPEGVLARAIQICLSCMGIG